MLTPALRHAVAPVSMVSPIITSTPSRATIPLPPPTPMPPPATPQSTPLPPPKFQHPPPIVPCTPCMHIMPPPPALPLKTPPLLPLAPPPPTPTICVNPPVDDTMAIDTESMFSTALHGMKDSTFVSTSGQSAGPITSSEVSEGSSALPGSSSFATSLSSAE